MDLARPFETFQSSAFRLEALPQYLVENERAAFEAFKASGELPKNLNSEWGQFVKNSVKHKKIIRRLRLISDELTPYEQFELQVYPGIQYGEDIRLNSRDIYAKEYSYDFWFFDDKYIAQMSYTSDGTFINSDIRAATDTEIKMYQYWLNVFETSPELT